MKLSEIKLPPIRDKLSEASYERLKRNLVALMLGQRLEVFQSESSVDGPWEAIKDVDAKLSKRRKDYKPNTKSGQRMKEKDKILHDTGVLRNSFSASSGKGDEYLKQSVEGDEVSIETTVEYAAIQNFGSDKKNHPPRPFDQFNDDHLEEINDLFKVHLNEQN